MWSDIGAKVGTNLRTNAHGLIAGWVCANEGSRVDLVRPHDTSGRIIWALEGSAVICLRRER